MVHETVQDNVARQRAIERSSHEATRQGILADAKRKGWKLTTTTNHADGKSEHHFTSPTHTIHVLHKGGASLYTITGKVPMRDQHLQNVKAVQSGMKNHRLIKTEVSPEGRHVSHYETLDGSRSIVVAHRGAEMLTLTTPRGR